MISDIKKSITLSFFELKVRNQRTYLGFFWYFLQPLFMFVILFYVKNNILSSDINDFVPYLLIGVMMLHFFISTTNSMASAITDKYDLLSYRKVDPNIFIRSRFLMSFWIHLFETSFVIIILFFLGYNHVFMYLFILPLYALFVFGVGKFLCVLSTKAFDVVHVWSYFCQIIWFITPVYFLSNNEDIITKLNPLVYFIDIARYVSYGLVINFKSLLFITIMLSLVSLLLSQLFFYTQKKSLSERIK